MSPSTTACSPRSSTRSSTATAPFASSRIRSCSSSRCAASTKVKNAGLLPLFQQARAIAQGLDRIVYEHVRREHNKDADRLANLAMDEGTKEEH